ncbi:hypothetical protein BGZ65_003511, partial [Modicella reniformis]
GSVSTFTLPGIIDTQPLHEGSGKPQFSPVWSHDPTTPSDERLRRRSPSPPTLEARQQAQAISRSFLELRIAEAAMVAAQHQTQQGQQIFGSTTPCSPSLLFSSSSATPQAEHVSQLSQEATDVLPAILEVVTAGVVSEEAVEAEAEAEAVAEAETEAAVGAEVEAEAEENISPPTQTQTLITPQQSPPSKNRYTIASAIIPTATRTTITATVSGDDNTTDKGIHVEEQVEGDEGGLESGTTTDFNQIPTTATSATTAIASSSTLDNTTTDTTSSDHHTPVLDYLTATTGASTGLSMTDEHNQVNLAEVGSPTKNVKPETAFMEAIKDLGKTYPLHPSQLHPLSRKMEAPVMVEPETIVYAVPSIGSEHHKQQEDLSSESTLLASIQEFSDTTTVSSSPSSSSQVKELLTAEKLLAIGSSDPLTARLLETIQPLLAQTPAFVDSVPQLDSQKDASAIAESGQGSTLGHVKIFSNDDGDGDDYNLTATTALDSFGADMEMGFSVGMDVDIGANAPDPLGSETIMDGKTVDDSLEASMSVDLLDPTLSPVSFSKEPIHQAVFNNNENLAPTEATIEQVKKEKEANTHHKEELVAAVDEAHKDMAMHLDENDVRRVMAAQILEVVNVQFGQTDLAVGSGLLQKTSADSIQEISMESNEDYTGEEFAKTLLRNVLSIKLEPMEISFAPNESMETAPTELMVNKTTLENPGVTTSTGQTIDAGLETRIEQGHIDVLETIDGTTGHAMVSRLQEGDESKKSVPEQHLSYAVEAEEIHDISETMSDVDVDGPQTVPDVKSLTSISTEDEDALHNAHDGAPVSVSLSPSSLLATAKPGARRRSATSPPDPRCAAVENDQSISPSQARPRHLVHHGRFPPQSTPLSSPYPSWHYVPGADLAFLSEMVASNADLNRFRREMQWLEERVQRPKQSMVSDHVLDKALGLTRSVPHAKFQGQQQQRTREDVYSGRSTSKGHGRSNASNMSHPPPAAHHASIMVQLSSESRVALSMLKMNLLSDLEEQTRLERDHEALQRSLARMEAKVLEKQKAQEEAEQEMREVLGRHQELEFELLRVRQLESECLEKRKQQRQQTETEIRRLEAILQMLQQQQQQ